MSLFSGGSSTYIYQTVPGRMSADLLRDFPWRMSDIVRCPTGHRTVFGRSPLESYDFYYFKSFKQKWNGARPMSVYPH